MWYTINYSCGHQGRVELFGSGKERREKVEWLESQECPTCRNQSNLSSIEKWEAEKGLEPITDGSEKQNAWARNIRQNFFRIYDQPKSWSLMAHDTLRKIGYELKDKADKADIAKRISKLLTGDENAKGQPIIDGLMGRVKARYNLNTECRFWIDNREDLTDAIVDATAEEILKEVL